MEHDAPLRLLSSAVFWLSTLLLLLPASASCADTPSPTRSLRVLILSGANNHDWRRTTPVIQEVIQSCPRFTVAGVVEDPAKCTAETFSGCDVVVSNWSAYPAMTGRQWGKAAEDAFVDFIRGGGGFVVIHAASATSQDWPEFQELVARTWGLDQTGHGTYHTFPVAVADKDHPITRGLPDFWITDELWHNMVSLAKEKPRVLLEALSAADQAGSGKREPVLLATSLGKGRGLNLVLGHDERSMQNVGWQTLLLRGTEWAATGAVTIPVPEVWPWTASTAGVPRIEPAKAIREALAYRHGQDRKPLYLVEEMARNALAADGVVSTPESEKPADVRKPVESRKPADESDTKGLMERVSPRLAARLAAALSAPGATVEGRACLLKQLSLVGTEADVPAIAALLPNPELSYPARYALERIPGAAPEKALREALGKIQGRLKAGVIGSLGERRVRAVVGDLAPLLAGPDVEVAEVAAAALGKIGGQEGAAALEAALGEAKGQLRPQVIDALLLCAEGLLAEGKGAEARRIYTKLWTTIGPDDPTALAPPMYALLRGHAASGDDKAVLMVIAALLHDDPRLQRGAVAIIREVLGDQRPIALLRNALKTEDAKVREASIRALAAWPTPAPIEGLLPIVMSEKNETLRGIALEGLARLASLPSGPSGPAPDRIVAILAEGLKLTSLPEERRGLLEALGSQATGAALSVALPFLKSPLLAGDAARAVVAIAERADDLDVDERIAALREAIAATGDPDLQQAAGRVVRQLLKPVNLALGATASSPDGLDGDGASSGDQAAIDGNRDTYWDEADDQPLYRLRVDFKEPTEVSAINVVGHAYRSHSPRDFDVLCDEKVVRSVKDAEFDPERNEFSVGFPPTRCSSLELKITGYWPRSPAIRELEIYSVPLPEPAGAGSTSLGEAASYSWQQSESAVALLNHGRVVWQLNFPRNGVKPWFHPVALLDGTQITSSSPPDHPWHRSLWFAWKELNGVNYWEEDAATGLSQGLTEVTDVKVTPAENYSARIDLTLSYHPPGKPPVLTERRELWITPADASGKYRIDWKCAFKAGAEDVLLKGGTAGGGYAGLSIRLACDTHDWAVIDSDGRKDTPAGGGAKGTHGQKARWMDWSFVDTASRREAGIAIVDHPANLRYPSQWHVCMDEKAAFGYFSPAPLWSEPYTLPAGGELVLKYRVVVHPGRGEAPQIERDWRRFRSLKRQ